MKDSFGLEKHAVIKTYIFDSHFDERKPLCDEDTAAMSDLWYIPFLGFNLDSLKGKKIEKAVLCLKVVGPNYPHEVELSSITQDWNQEYATYYECDKDKAWTVNNWASEVIMGQGFSLHYRQKTSFNAENGILRIPVPQDLVYSIINGESSGLALVDSKSKMYAENQEDTWRYFGGQAAKKFNVNPDKGDVPTLEIEYNDAALVQPEGVFNLEAAAVQDQDNIEYASVVLNWSKSIKEAEPYCFYNIYAAEAGDGCLRLIGRYMTPRYVPGAKNQGTEITHLKPDTEYRFEVAVSNGLYESELTGINIRTMPPVELPEIKRATDSRQIRREPVVNGQDYSVYLADDTIKINPVSGCVFEADAEGYITGKGKNIKDYTGTYSKGELLLTGAPGEKMAFQLVFENKTAEAKNLSISLKGIKQGVSFNSYRVWYLNSKGAWYPEAAVPLENGTGMALPFNGNAIEGQVYQSVLIDVMLADKLEPRNYCFKVEIELNGKTEYVDGCLKVVPLSLNKPDFTFEANGYVATPLFMGIDYYDSAYDHVEEEYYRTALDHDMTINIVPYDQMGQMQPRFAPKTGWLDGRLCVTDWSEWDAHFAKFLDGTYTLEKYGKRVPITHMYLPFHENWPLPIDEYYRVKTDCKDYPNLVNDVKLKTATIEEDFLPGYKEGIKSVIKDFIMHFDEKGWQHVHFQFYLNNKHYYKEKRVFDTWLANRTIGNEGKGSSWWLLDEPNHRDDFDAIRYYGSILKEAQKDLNSGYNIKFRLDISGYNYMFDFLDGIVDLPCINARAFGFQEDKARKRSRNLGETNWIYTSLNEITASNGDMTMLVVDTWLKGSAGMLPWFNFALDENFEKPASTSGFYPGNRFGIEGPVVSLRIKAARKGMELLKYLETFRKAFGYGNIQMKAYAAHFLKLKGQALSRFFEDAGTVQFTGDNCAALEEMKQDIIKRVMAKQGLLNR